VVWSVPWPTSPSKIKEAPEAGSVTSIVFATLLPKWNAGFFVVSIMDERKKQP
jgi:hypothetical protein